jgi:hypothetical protein
MIVWCRMTTWAGSATVWYAEHYYARLCGDGADRDLYYVMNAKEAQKLAESDPSDDYPYNAGDRTSRFFSEDAIKYEAIKQYKEMYPGASLLVYGDRSTIEPQLILDGPEGAVEWSEALVDACEACGWWEGDDKLTACVASEWDIVIGEFDTDPNSYYRATRNIRKGPAKKNQSPQPFGIEVYLDLPFTGLQGWHVYRWFDDKEIRDRLVADACGIRGDKKFRKIDR